MQLVCAFSTSAESSNPNFGRPDLEFIVEQTHERLQASAEHVRQLAVAFRAGDLETASLSEYDQSLSELNRLVVRLESEMMAAMYNELVRQG